MRTLRQFHLYLGCIFAPLIIYFSLSGAWQLFRLNDVPKDETPSFLNSIFHELSKPHTHSTLPTLDPKLDHSNVFTWCALLMSMGMIITSLLGIILAVKYSKSSRNAILCIVLGIFLPLLFLFLRI